MPNRNRILYNMSLIITSYTGASTNINFRITFKLVLLSLSPNRYKENINSSDLYLQGNYFKILQSTSNL